MLTIQPLGKEAFFQPIEHVTKIGYVRNGSFCLLNEEQALSDAYPISFDLHIFGNDFHHIIARESIIGLQISKE